MSVDDVTKMHGEIPLCDRNVNLFLKFEEFQQHMAQFCEDIRSEEEERGLPSIFYL